MRLHDLERDLNSMFSPRARTTRKPATTEHVAHLPDGREHVIRRKREGRRTVFVGLLPDGNEYTTTLRDVKVFMRGDFPGVAFSTR